MTDSNDVGIVKTKNDLTITLDGGGNIVIEDGEGRRGGNVASNKGKKVSWTNDTGGACRLVFRQFLPDDATGRDAGIWPFDTAQEPPGKEQVIPSARTRDLNPWEPRLKLKAGGEYVKYDVQVTMPDGTTHHVDPIIIIRT